MEAFDTRDGLIDAAATATCAALAEGLARGGRATLMCSGGSTPGPVYTALSRCGLDWSLVDVGLADERWVPDDHDASNAGLVANTLLTGRPGSAVFHPMYNAAPEPAAGLADTAARYDQLMPADMLILGMGADGHTLSWFPGADGLERAMDPAHDVSVAAIEARPSPVTGEHTARMTLTANSVRRARRALLLITGEDKREVFEDRSADYPVHQLDGLLGERLSVYWAP